MAERLGALPLGELHAEGVCAYCSTAGLLDAPYPGMAGRLVALKRTVHVATQAVAHVCVDTVACERRRYKAKL